MVADLDALETLPRRELVAGLAEVIKYGVIRDAEFFSWLEESLDALLARDTEALVHAVSRSCEIKARVVAADERESGQREILNFGHTFAHGLETLTGYEELNHGEAGRDRDVDGLAPFLRRRMARWRVSPSNRALGRKAWRDATSSQRPAG